MTRSEQKVKSPSKSRAGTSATLSSSLRAGGSGAPSPRRLHATLAALTLVIAALAITAAPALAAPPTVTTPVVSNVSYTSAHVEGKITTDGSGILGKTAFLFQYSTDGTNWSTGYQSEFSTHLTGAATEAPVEATISLPKGGTSYFVRLRAENLKIGGQLDESTSPGPNPEFTTLAVAPPAIPDPVETTAVFSTSATAKSTLIRPANGDPAFDVSCHFEYLSDADYAVERSEVQELTVAAEGGTFQLEYEGHKTSQIAFDAPAATVQGALEGLPAFPAGALTVTGGPGDQNATSPYILSFGGSLANQNVALVHSDGAGLSGNTTAINVFASTEGRTEGFEGAVVRQCAQNPISPDKIDGSGKAEVSAPLGCTAPLTEAPETCLQPGTTYHLRLVAENAAPGIVTKEAAATFATTAKVAPPTVIATDDASGVAKRSAQASGEIERPSGADPALDTSCRFEFVTDEQFTTNPPGEEFAGAGQAPCAEPPLTSPAPDYPAVTAEVNGELTGLEPVTTYHLLLAAENGGGAATKTAVGTFTTLAIIPPTFTVDSITEIGYTGFRVTGTADPGNQGTYPWFEFAPAGTEEWGGGYVGSLPFLPPGSPAQQYSQKFPCFASDGTFCTSPLRPGTTYQVRFGGREEEQFTPVHSDPPYEEFTTKGTNTPPSGTLSISDVNGTSAHFSGTVDTHAPAGPLPQEAIDTYTAEWRIECTPACKDANGNEIAGTVEAEEGNKAISVDAKRLEPDTQYEEVKLTVHNSLETVETAAQSFHTLQVPPKVTSTLGASDGEGGYTLQGIVNPNKHTITGCKFEWGPTAPKYAFSADCSPKPQTGTTVPVTVEAHLASLNPDVDYHSLLVVTYDAGLEETGVDQGFKATLRSPITCPNEQLRKENNSLALPECRAYEMVSPPGKEGFGGQFEAYAAGGDRVLYESGAGNIARSGQGVLNNYYVTNRTAAGWMTIPNLNGSSGSVFDAPSEVVSNGPKPDLYSKDLLSSVWTIHRPGDPGPEVDVQPYLRGHDGLFHRIGVTLGPGSQAPFATSDDLTHLVFDGIPFATAPGGYRYGPGVYEFVGTGNSSPRRVDVDNSENPISGCVGIGAAAASNATASSVSRDGSTIFFTVFGGCGGSNPPADEIWARVGGTTSIDASASECTRADCNAPANATFGGATPDGSRVFFTTIQQLVDADTDQTNDLYACDIPSGTPAPVAAANSCTALMQVSGAHTGAAVESVGAVSDNGDTVLFTAKGALASNDDAQGEGAVAGDHNLYVWRQDAAHPDGQTIFIGRMPSASTSGPSYAEVPQSTPDGHYLVFNTTGQLVPTDTDNASDVYRYDVESGELTRVSTNVSGVAGNGPFDAEIPISGAVSDDGQKITFTTAEALSPADGNAEPDVYLWTPDRVSLISTGASGSGGVAGAIDGSGQDIFFGTAGALAPADGDSSGDVYDARVGGGFSFAPPSICTGEKCQPEPTPLSPNPPSPANQPNGEGNVKPLKPCLKGKVRNKKGKCVKKPHQKHSGKKHHGKKHSHQQGGGK